ncbi:uncharacterized protein V1518DRAFT_415905 [Limtongia smithiae]|uniref:uncharacterized protein n=1 Tax=Limtongia smithiae TaxID=1125753 RepID=UPI0034CFBA79
MIFASTTRATLRTSALAASRAATRPFSATPAASDLARITLIGRLGADPERLTSANGRDYARYSVAVSSPQRNGETSWYHVVSFDPNLDYLSNNFTKGALVYVEANATLQPFETADGRRVGSLQLVQRNIQRLSGKPKESEDIAAATAVGE